MERERFPGSFGLVLLDARLELGGLHVRHQAFTLRRARRRVKPGVGVEGPMPPLGANVM
jgi:hypothetical protein